MKLVVAGGGVFGLTAAIELASRGHHVSLFEQGSIPNGQAASTDISKIVRMEYGTDRDYFHLAARARNGWLDWNERWAAAGLSPLYHDSGVLMCSRGRMAESGYEADSYRMLQENNFHPVRLGSQEIARSYPAWREGFFADGFYNPAGGWVESGEVLKRLARTAVASGVSINEDTPVTEVVRGNGAISGVLTSKGQVAAEAVVLACGSWNGRLASSLRHCIRPTGHPVFHFRPNNPEMFAARVFPTFTADVSTTGYYGFPVNRDGVVKIGKHTLGLPVDPDQNVAVPTEQVVLVKSFLSDAIPALADSELVYSRICPYADTPDEDFWIDEDPDCQGLVVAGGGSGHGFKFAPVLGSLVADAVERKENSLRHKFRWRPDVDAGSGKEAARCREAL